MSFLKSLFCDCCGLSDNSSGQTVERVRSSLKSQTHVTRQPQSQNSGPPPDPDVVRQNAAAAAEARMRSQDNRGVKSHDEIRRLQERQAKIDKATEEYERKGGSATQNAGLRWQMN